MKKISTNFYVIGALSIAALIILAKMKSDASKPTTEEVIATAKKQYENELAARVETDKVLNERLLERLGEAERYVSGFKLEEKEGLQAADYVATCTLLDEYGGVAKGYANDDNKEIKTRAQKLQKNLKALRIRVMPVLRKRWVEASDRQLWENDIDARCLGKGNTVVEFTGGTFAANANIKTAQDGISDALYKLRFKQSRYKWYSGDDEYTYYKMETPADGDL